MYDVRKLVKVKPLEWVPTFDKIPDNAWMTETQFARWYIVVKFLSANTVAYRFGGNNYNTLEAAKAAAQADYEARIYAALTPASDGRAEGLREAAEIARLRAEVERLKEAERTAWERGRDAAADEIDAKCERTCDYPDGCRCEAAKAIRALTPEASHD